MKTLTLSKRTLNTASSLGEVSKMAHNVESAKMSSNTINGNDCRGI